MLELSATVIDIYSLDIIRAAAIKHESVVNEITGLTAGRGCIKQQDGTY
jgi:hypothetical protein